MIIECPDCAANVGCEAIAEHKFYNPHEDPSPWTTVLTACPRCGQTLVGGCYDHERPEVGLETLFRLWPVPPRVVSWEIPELVRESIVEANTCFRAGAYSACAVMCGRALEAVCKIFGSQKMLGEGLKELRNNQVIDGRLYQWASELQKSRNLSAHPSGQKVSKSDAQDLLDFTNAICEYVFVLSAKFEAFQRRRQELSTKEPKPVEGALPPQTPSEN
jgi:hypothetical protein